MNVLGISAFYHDSAAALIQDGRVVAAAQEERFSRKRHDARFPHAAIRFCLDFAGLKPADVEIVAFYDKPFLKFERLLETYVAFAPRGFQSFRMAMPIWLREKLFLKDLLVKELRRIDDQADWLDRLLFSEHHLSHAASAFYPSPFSQAAILTLDGVGEWATSSLAAGNGADIEIRREIHFPHSLGLLYSAFTYYTGFKVNSGEYKLMGLAPYGEPIFAKAILEHLIDVKQDGSFRLNLDYFDYCTGLRMVNGKFETLFGGPARRPEEPLTQRHMDLAASVQQVTEEIMVKLARSAAAETGQQNLCLAGGVALNCVANGKILRDGAFRKIWIQPAAGDAGGAVGAALLAYHGHLGKERAVPAMQDGMSGAYLGPVYAQSEIETRLLAEGAKFTVLEDDKLLDSAARDLADGLAIGWFQGRMEFGPRALGGRSILGDAKSPAMQRILNLKVKFRESFRPFAPAVMAEHAGDWFDLEAESPYMLLVAEVQDRHRIAQTTADESLFGIERLNIARSAIPAVTHVDYSARVQTVHAETNPRFHALLGRFKAATGCPVLVNTSFNVRGEPIVCTPEDAFRCFMGTQLDSLVIGNCRLVKSEQDAGLARDYSREFSPD